MFLSLISKYPVTIIVSLAALLACAFPPLAQWWQLDFASVNDGQWWRIWTGHVTHYDGNHLFWDLLMFAVLGAVNERPHPRQVAVAIAVMMAGISIAISVFCSQITIYRGLSGLDTGLFVWLAADQIRQSVRNRDRLAAGFWIAPCVALVGKLLYEITTGQTLFVDSSDFTPLVEAHLAGALIGFLLYSCATSAKVRDFTIQKAFQ